MEKIYSVRIIRTNEQVIQGIYLKEFWKLCGVYVRECVIEEETETKYDSQQVDCNIIVGRMENQDVLESNLKAKHTFFFDDSVKNEGIRIKDEKLGTNLQTLLEQMENELEWDGLLKKQFKKICLVFVKNNYAYYEYKCHLFIQQMKDSRQELLEAYRKCLSQLVGNEDDLLEQQYTVFAYLNCARKYERVCTEDGKIGSFKEEELMDFALKLLEKDPQFSAADMLAGMIGLSYQPLWEDGKKYLKEAIKKEKKQKHCAFMHYALGHFYEWQEEDWDNACIEYEKIRGVDSDNFRMNYKIACKNLYEEREDDATIIFEELYLRMKAKVREKWVTPLELEYYYKCARFLNDLGLVDNAELYKIQNDLFFASNCIRNLFEKEELSECKNMLIDNMENRVRYCR